MDHAVVAHCCDFRPTRPAMAPVISPEQQKETEKHLHHGSGAGILHLRQEVGGTRHKTIASRKLSKTLISPSRNQRC